MANLNIRRIVCGLLEENSYLVFLDEREDAFIIDPGDNFEELMAAIQASGKRLAYILLTHGHFDHTLCAPRLREATGAKIIAHSFELEYLKDENLNSYQPSLCREAFVPFEADQALEILENGSIELCGISMQVLYTPGHTPGGMCFHIPEHQTLFSGDILFENGFGRTDLPGGSTQQIRRSLRKLLKLPEDTDVYAGHGASTLIRRVVDGFQ